MANYIYSHETKTMFSIVYSKSLVYEKYSRRRVVSNDLSHKVHVVYILAYLSGAGSSNSFLSSA